MKHQSTCKCYYCAKRRREQQAQIATLSGERQRQMAGVSR